jgi:hypothetical protein
MLDWIVRYQWLGFPLGVVGVALAIWQSHKQIASLVNKLVDLSLAVIPLDYRATFRRRKIRRLTEEYERLQNFSSQDQMDSLSTIFSRFAQAASLCLYLSFFVMLSAFPVGVTLLGPLEAEILKQPIPLVPSALTFTLRFYEGVFLIMFGGAVLLLNGIVFEAYNLSPSWRVKRLNVIAKMLAKLGADVPVK